MPEIPRRRPHPSGRPRSLEALPDARRTAQRPIVVRIVQRTGTRGLDTDGSLALAPEPSPRTQQNPRLSLAEEPALRRETAEVTVRLVAEVLAGTRPPRHLADRALPQVWQALAVHEAFPARAPVAPPRLLRTWMQDDTVPGTIETGAVVVLDGRAHALALRLVRRRGRWLCTAIETTIPSTRRPRHSR